MSISSESIDIKGLNPLHSPDDSTSSALGAPLASAEHRQLAILGDAPAFTEALLVGRPNISNRDAFLTRIETMLDSRQFTNMGPMVQHFETRVAEISEQRHAIATCNATVGLELAVSALGMSGEVIVPSFTFIASTHALWRQGIRPIFCDIDPATHCLDPEKVRAAITPQTTGILGVSLWGNYAGEAELRKIADDHGLAFLLDSAHSFGCMEARGGLDERCHAEVFSFHATKCLHALEGGAIVTSDDELAERLRLMVNFGFSGEDRVTYLGTNGKMSEASAAMGLTSLEAKDEVFAHNRENFLTYAKGLAPIPGIRLLTRNPNSAHNFQYIVAEVDAETTGISRNDIVSALRLENVLARRYFHPSCHRMEPYRSLFPDAGQVLPETEAVSDRVMVLPNGLAVQPPDIDILTSRIAAIVARGPEVRAALENCTDPRLPEFSS